ncbi:MAG: type II toxin-antitoxin system mRNA interferase toxin, RelE/StbE family [Halieaceae bacterium]|nr:type II toxin-antitoxin system mRNA interferase toxin, RelE/StbE family [Halieaceae bacterium]
MIRSFRHKGLKLLFEKGDRRKVQSEYADKIERILARLEESSAVDNMNLPGFRLHPLKGELSGYWAVTVSGNWRLIFRFERGHASEVDLLDYH